MQLNKGKTREVVQRIMKEKQNPSAPQKMFICKILNSQGFSKDGANTFEVSVGDKSTGIVSMDQFQRERISM